MKRAILLLAAAVMLIPGCKNATKGAPAPAAPEKKVMARAVPERADDFVFENDLIAGRFYGEALEGNPTSPGIDIWVKLPGALVADSWYAEAQNDPEYYHHDHGGKDCYKVAVSLGGGASVPLVDGKFAFAPTNYRSSEILEDSPEKVVFVLHYPEWEVGSLKVSLDKKVTVIAGSYFSEVEDTYNYTGAESLTVAAGFFLHGRGGESEMFSTTDRIAVWEVASDQSVEPEDGMIGVAVVMPGAEKVYVDSTLDHALCLKTVASGEPLRYSFASAWSKGNIKTSGDWFAEVEKH
ncbi:MAG: DUF4861 family protein [Bacteroidales bacterium]|nr:DUF4861 family protein [Bacteroidales bacterium]